MSCHARYPETPKRPYSWVPHLLSAKCFVFLSINIRQRLLFQTPMSKGLDLQIRDGEHHDVNHKSHEYPRKVEPPCFWN